MLDKDYPILLKFHIHSKITLILDVKYINGFYFEQYQVVCDNGHGYMHVFHSTVYEREAAERYEKTCNDAFWSR